jgi:hypothetical protein
LIEHGQQAIERLEEEAVADVGQRDRPDVPVYRDKLIWRPWQALSQQIKLCPRRRRPHPMIARLERKPRHDVAKRPLDRGLQLASTIGPASARSAPLPHLTPFVDASSHGS